ncbi:MAG: SynChlorMet cassette protein ScmD [Candidatus Neomarinimicrobiota bacterium]|nr:MAG: SynChlorMet cassette protein ScmD [Candidatus Neomarinimicrobiota bacterium]
MITDYEYPPKKRDSILMKPLDDGAVLYEPETESVHTLNPSAAFIWVYCDGAHSIGDIIELIKKQFTDFEQDPETAVFDIINKFKSLDLLI